MCVPHTGEGSGKPLRYSRLGNPTDRGACQAAVHGVAQSDMAEQAHMCVHHLSVPFRTALPPPTPPHPSRSAQSTELSSPCSAAASHELFIPRVVGYVHVSATLSTHPTLPFPSPCPQAILYTCVSIPVSFLSCPHLQTPLGSHSSLQRSWVFSQGCLGLLTASVPSCSKSGSQLFQLYNGNNTTLEGLWMD